MAKRDNHAIAVVRLLSVAAGLSLFFVAPRAGAEEEAALPPPPLVLTVTPGTGGGPWKLRIENTGELPMRIAADPRLLVLEVTPPAGSVTKKTARADATGQVRCILPDDARPPTDEGRELVIPSKRAWSVTFDPLFYCFSARERETLVAGATVKAGFGWPAPAAKIAQGGRGKAKPASAPFVAAPVGAAVGKLAAVKALEASPITLAEAADPPGNVSIIEHASSPEHLAISLQDSVDVARGVEITTNVTVANPDDTRATLLFRGETVRFSVSGPQGSLACGARRTIGSPIRELYSSIGPRSRASIAVLLTAKCSFDTFDEPGIYRVTATLDTTGASARAIGLKSWDGEITSRKPMLLRVRAARKPRPQARPTLD